ncbi:MAG: hypothetical protein KC544_15465 [Gemmatimonadetes bacterium]|nr:hypothetical protein [Gemmatimonadota bacterium]
MRIACLLAALAVTVAAGACRPDDQRTDTIDPNAAMQVRAHWPPEVAAQLDSGSTAFRDDDYETALGHYTRVTEMAPDIAAGWFGIYMAQHALGHTEAAAAAYERAQGMVPGATLLHPADTVR